MSTTHKAITIQQPHVAAIFAGLKRFETRSWPTKYRGPLLIHAGKAVDASVGVQFRDAHVTGVRFNTGSKDPVQVEKFARLLRRDATGLGCILGVVELVGCWQADGIRRETHRGWGDFTPGRFAFELANPRLFKTPIPTRGQLGLWTYRGEIEGP